MAIVYFTRRREIEGSYLSLVGVDKLDGGLRTILEEYQIVAGDIEGPRESRMSALATYRRQIRKSGHKVVLVSNEEAGAMLKRRSRGR